MEIHTPKHTKTPIFKNLEIWLRFKILFNYPCNPFRIDFLKNILSDFINQLSIFINVDFDNNFFLTPINHEEIAVYFKMSISFEVGSDLSENRLLKIGMLIERNNLVLSTKPD